MRKVKGKAGAEKEATARYQHVGTVE